MNNIIGFMSNKFNAERWSWIESFCRKSIQNNNNIKLFLTGESLFFYKKLLKHYNHKNNEDFIRISENFTIKFDRNEKRILGFPTQSIISEKKDNMKNNYIEKTFYNEFINSLDGIFGSKIGILLMKSPYFNRDPVYAINLMQTAMEINLYPELYLYLDGLHNAQNLQKPSEFENIGQKIEQIYSRLHESSDRISKISDFYACSRCATARGYVEEVDENGNFISSKIIKPVSIVNLNKIIEKFEEFNPILSLNSLLIYNSNIIKKNKEFGNNNNNNNNNNPEDHNKENISKIKPNLIILVTQTPYSSEWAFGALSFGIAASNHGIKTSIIFIEDGIYSLVGKHNIQPKDKIFNIQDIIMATLDDENLHYYGYLPHVIARDEIVSDLLEEIQLVDQEKFNEIIMDTGSKGLNRVIIF